MTERSRTRPPAPSRLRDAREPPGHGLGRLEKSTLQDQAYRELKRALMRGHFPPGEILTIRAIAAELGTSTMPARDALQRLIAERALNVLPRRSAQVPAMTSEEFDELTTIRLRVESLAAELAAPRIESATIDRIDALNRTIRDAIGDGDAAGMLEANMALHFAAYEAAGAPLLLGIIESFWLRIGPLLLAPFRRIVPASDVFAESLDWHQALADAFRQRDPQGAGQAVRSDIANTAAWYHENYEFAGASPEADMA